MSQDETVAQIMAEARARGLQYAINDVASWAAHARANLGDENGAGLSVLQSWASMEILIETIEENLLDADASATVMRIRALLPKLDGLDITLRREFEVALDNPVGAADTGPSSRPARTSHAERIINLADEYLTNHRVSEPWRLISSLRDELVRELGR